MRSCESPSRSIRHWPSRAYFAAAILLLGASLASWVGLDERTISWVRSSGLNPATDFCLEAFARLGKAWLQIWLLLVWFLASRRRREVQAGLLALAIVAVTVNPLKYAVGRVRPYSAATAQEAGRRARVADHHLSFPSGDTAAAFAVAGAVVPTLSVPLGVALLGTSAGVGGLRVAAQAHYPSDVLAGAAIGLLAGWLAIRVMDRWGRPDRAVPFEQCLVWAGVVALPVAMRFSEGPGELILFLRSYGLIVPCVLLVAGSNDLWRQHKPSPFISFLAKNRFIIVSLAIVAVIVKNVLAGDKPHMLLDGPISPRVSVGVAMIVAGVSLRIRRDSRDPSRLCLPALLIVCGLLMQLADWRNWFVVMPLLVATYGASRICDPPWFPVHTPP